MRAKRPVAVAPWWKWINKVVGQKVSCGELRPLGRLTHKTPYKRWPRCAPPTARHTRENDINVARRARSPSTLRSHVRSRSEVGCARRESRESREEGGVRCTTIHLDVGARIRSPEISTLVSAVGASDTFPAPAATRIDDPKCVTPISFVESQPRKQQRACTVQRPACSLALRVTGAPRNH